MEHLIIDMIKHAEIHRDYEMIGYVKELLSQFAMTYNCPSNWRDLKEEISLEYQDESSWVYENLELWDL